MLIFLVDLTYTQQTIASDIMPYAIGCIATYTSKVLGDSVALRIFKTPKQLVEALSIEVPEVIGFSNYAWNFNLSYIFAKEIRKWHPETTIVFGGPNYPQDKHSREEFLRKHAAIDYYVVGEGELPFSQLIKELLSTDIRPQVDVDVPSIHYFSKSKNKVVLNHSAPRIEDLGDIPSPYTQGVLDEFFDGRFLPIIQTVRGCPFRCTYCCEGARYYNKINRKPLNYIREELFYIARRIKPVVDCGGRADLHIADSNFGMFREDYFTFELISQCRKEFGWPSYVNVSTGKSNKDRIIKGGQLIDGALRVAGSVQSMDKVVLSNIKRSNISKKQLLHLAIEATASGANSYSELILALPGETKESHFKSIAELIDMGFNYINLYTLMLLPGSEMWSTEYRKRFGLITRYRVIPRCFGFFEYNGDRLTSAEIEEVVVSTDSMSFDEYLQCRKMHLIVALFYNDGLFYPLHQLFKSESIPIFKLLKDIYNNPVPERLNRLFDDFLNETRGELWENKEALYRYLKENIDKYISGEYGSNLLFKYKSLGMLQYIGEMGEVVLRSALKILSQHIGKLNNLQRDCIKEVVTYCVSQAKGLFEDNTVAIKMISKFDFDSIIKQRGFYLLGEGIGCYKERLIVFRHTEEQLDTIKRFKKIYGTDLIGISRILAKVNTKKLLRQPCIINTV